MARRPLFKHRKTPDGWMVIIPASMSKKGKLERRFFQTEELAKKFAAALHAQHDAGDRGGLIPHALALQAAEAAAILAPHGISLLEAARAAVAKVEASGTSEAEVLAKVVDVLTQPAAA